MKSLSRSSLVGLSSVSLERSQPLKTNKKISIKTKTEGTETLPLYKTQPVSRLPLIDVDNRITNDDSSRRAASSEQEPCDQAGQLQTVFLTAPPADRSEAVLPIGNNNTVQEDDGNTTR